jgi:hypothetical protein
VETVIGCKRKCVKGEIQWNDIALKIYEIVIISFIRHTEHTTLRSVRLAHFQGSAECSLPTETWSTPLHKLSTCFMIYLAC